MLRDCLYSDPFWAEQESAPTLEPTAAPSEGPTVLRRNRWVAEAWTAQERNTGQLPWRVGLEQLIAREGQNRATTV
jgi:hypothetical protein